MATQAPELITSTAERRSHGQPIHGDDVVRWILTGGHGAADSTALVDQLCWHLVGDGLPLWRVSLSISTLHPQLQGLGVRWWRDRELVEEVQVRHGAGLTADYLDSPMRPTMEHGETVRYRLDSDDITAFPLLQSMHEAGGTDYLSTPLTPVNRRHQVITWTTDRAGGFTESDIAAITRLLPALGVVVEAKAMRQLTASVLDTYLGRTIGRHILNGEIQRRTGQELRAVLMAVDLRGFTALSDRLVATDLIALLDDYFDAVSSPIQARGGEVLKFVGDGLLAIFEIGANGEAAAAEAALAAAREALELLDARNVQRRDDGHAIIRIGIGLHVGTVTYGNVGAIDRLDFTAIGPAVNLVCRLESLTKRLDRPLLMSHDFSTLAPLTLVSLGFHPVRGFSEPEEVFGLAVTTGER